MIENHCQQHKLDCVWRYEPSIQEQRAALQGNIAKLKQQQLAAENRKSAASKEVNAVIEQINQESALLQTLTGVFAGGKRKKCQERLEVLKREYVAKQQIMDQHGMQIANLASQIQAEEAKLQKLGM